MLEKDSLSGEVFQMWDFDKADGNTYVAFLC